jgi:hypothetical protein
VFYPCVGIVPCTGFYCPKTRFPPTETAADEKELLPNAPNKENGIEPIGMV